MTWCASGPVKMLAALSGGTRDDSAGVSAAPRPAPEASAAAAVVSQARRPSQHSNSSSISSTPSEAYDIGEVVGTGSYGKVYRAWNKSISTECGVKIIEASSADKRETMLHTGLDHPHIVRLFETFEEEGQIYIAMELCNGGDLYYALKGHGRFVEAEARVAFAQIMHAVDFMHSRCIAHRDIKLENFLLEKPGVPLAENMLKLIDFGFAARFTPGSANMMTKCGSDGFVAPEVMYSKSYDERCDIFSCGVVLHCLLCGRMPFKATTTDVKEKIYFGGSEIKKSLTPNARALIENMLCKTPSKRPTAQAVLTSPWLRAVKDGAASGWLSKSVPVSLMAPGNLGRITNAVHGVMAPQGVLAAVWEKSSKLGNPMRQKGSHGMQKVGPVWSGRPQRLSA